jgi:hypothetical protein
MGKAWREGSEVLKVKRERATGKEMKGLIVRREGDGTGRGGKIRGGEDTHRQCR